MNAPKLRFSEFKGSWKSSMLGNYLEEYSQITKGGSDIPIATSSRKGLFLQNEYFNGNRSYETDDVNYKIVPRGFATYRHMSDDSTFHFNINSIQEKVLVSSEYPVFNTKKTANLYFIIEYLNHAPSFKKFCMTQKLGGTRTRLYYKNLQRFELKIPLIEEQQKIADFFILLDQRIEKQQEKVELLQAQKKGLMQKIFSQELRFKNENGQEYPVWEERNLKELCKINTGNKDTQDKKENGLYPFFVRSQIVEKIDTYSFDGEAILTAGDGVGVGKVFHYINGKFDYHQRVYMLSDFKNCVGKYIYYYFTQNFMKEAKKYNAKTSVDSVRREMLTKMKFPYPCIEEQKKIADFLSKTDSKISTESQKLEQLHSQKKAFMQHMFI